MPASQRTMRSKTKSALCFCLLLFAPRLICAAEFSANNYSAKGDGVTIDTAAIQKAIDAASISSGTVVFKPGTYISGSLFLKTGVHLRVDEGVEIHGAQDQAAYPVMATRVAGIRVNDIDIQGVNSVFSVQFNWNPGFSYATIPPEIRDYPDYWKILATPVPPAQGLPHLRNITISDIKATGARSAFSVDSYRDSPLTNVTFNNFDVESRVAGSITNADNWTFTNTHIRAADGSFAAVKDSNKITGLPSK